MTAQRIACAVAISLTAFACPALSQRAPHGIVRSVHPAFPSTRSRADTAPHEPDRWFAPDKRQHFLASLVIQMASYGALRLSGARQHSALIGASLLSATAGIGKEVLDARGHGDPSWRDLAWDGIGIGAGSGLSVLADGGK